MKLNKWMFLWILVLPTLLTGCWDSVEINERHVVLEIALDKNPDVDTSKPFNEQERYLITYTIPDIGKLSGEDSLSEDVKTSEETRSTTVSASVDEVETKTQNTISFSHIKALVLGEELLKDRALFKSALDGLLRDMQMGRDTAVFATHGNAGELTKAPNKQNPILGLYVMKYFENSERPTSYAKQQELGRMIVELQNTGITTMPILKMSENDAFEISGAAVIKDYEFVDWLDRDEVRGELFVEGQIKNVPIVVEYKGSYLTYTIDEESSRINFVQREGKWAVELDIRAKGSITEYISTNGNNIFNEEDIDEIAKLVQAEINKQITRAVEKSREINTDFLNIGLAMYRKNPELWNRYKETWEQNSYKEFPIYLLTTVTIQNTGVLE